MNSKNIKIILIALVLALVVFIGFKYLNGSKVSSDSLLESVKGQSDVGRDIIIELNQLNAVRLDDEVFKSNAFTSLQDFTLEVIQEPQGRNNPFAPLGFESPFQPVGGKSTR